MSLPILYSLQRCPYCIRARLVLLLAKQPVILREVVISNIPPEMLAISPKGTVPVLLLNDSSVIDESIDIIIWALKQNDPHNLLLQEQPNALPGMLNLITRNDNEFIPRLEKYKAAARYHDNAEINYRQQCEPFTYHLEQRLTENDYLMGNHPSLADYAILPFIRQFSRVDRKWYLKAPYPNLQRWLTKHYQTPLYSKAMVQHPKWQGNNGDVIFGCG
ncbi:glutathione S-transferase [uncultured Photobacterium sp.]|uniref:glutathione S-transferase n=1 Tax=uncultured Photobacterium sp. TaxID=173973 RepID=UPI00263520FE|nr:glutathione S-transferase [uncultured Photobacterium sp.]